MTRRNNKNGGALLKNGAHVEIHGLQNATHLNGKTGRLKTFHREGSHAGRWEVRAAGGESHAVKPENLKHVAGSNIAATTPSIRAGPMGPASGAVYHPRNDAWANDLSVEDQYEWLSNCYQMRCDDDYVYGDCYVHGPYDPEATPASLATDFLSFCLLAQRSECVPTEWQWPDFLHKASGFVVFAFEKSDAQQRWGSENVFCAVMGGRSLRYTADTVYGSSWQEPGNSRPAEHVMQEAERPTDAIYNEIGGRNVWNTFQQELACAPRFSSSRPLETIY